MNRQMIILTHFYYIFGFNDVGYQYILLIAIVENYIYMVARFDWLKQKTKQKSKKSHRILLVTCTADVTDTERPCTTRNVRWKVKTSSSRARGSVTITSSRSRCARRYREVKRSRPTRGRRAGFRYVVG